MLKLSLARREADSDLVIAEEWGWGLRVAHLVKNLSFVGSDAAGGEQSAVFRLGDEGADDGDTCRVCGDGWGG